MAKTVNLNRARKSQARSQAKEKADRNAAFHGLTKAQKDRARTDTERARRELDGGKLDTSSDPDE